MAINEWHKNHLTIASKLPAKNAGWDRAYSAALYANGYIALPTTDTFRLQ
jgi:hypothetical protein